MIMTMLLYHSGGAALRAVSSAASLLPLASLLLLAPPAASHGYLKSPRSRNFVAYEDLSWWPVDPANPLPESEPQSANVGGVDARCGIIAEARNYDLPQNHAGGPMGSAAQACWAPGVDVELEVVLTAHHKGEP